MGTPEVGEQSVSLNCTAAEDTHPQGVVGRVLAQLTGGVATARGLRLWLRRRPIRTENAQLFGLYRSEPHGDRACLQDHA
jgi:hypothetical protein